MFDDFLHLTDGVHTVCVAMFTKECGHYTPDRAASFFRADQRPKVKGILKNHPEKEACVVHSVSHCLAQAYDWRDYAGDYKDTMPYIPEELREEYDIPKYNRVVLHAYYKPSQLLYEMPWSDQKWSDNKYAMDELRGWPNH